MGRFFEEDISSWAGKLDTLISSLPRSIVSRVVVIESTDSTQDAAIRFGQGQPGLLVIASKQNNGRGSHGRRWDDGNRATLPCTFTLSACCSNATMLSACVACAVHEALNTFLPRTVNLGIKWPNDIVVQDGERELKLAGILIEQKQGLSLAGIGINCTQTFEDWSTEYANHAVSLRGLGLDVSRFDLVCQLLTSMSEWLLTCDEHIIESYYQRFNAMIGTTRTFGYNNVMYTGVVEHLDPMNSVTIREGGRLKTLPIAQTQHIRQSTGEMTHPGFA